MQAKNSQNKCTFVRNYDNSKTSRNEIFSCKLKAVNCGLCMFHDESYLNDSTKTAQVKKSFLTLLQNSIKQKKPLVCVGYHLPEIKITCEFKIPIHMIETTFHGMLNFDNCEFSDNVQFSRCVFLKEASFTGSTFKKEADFSHAVFNGSHTTFIQTKFEKPSTFTESHFRTASFNFAKFEEVNFISSIFDEPIEFWYTDFNKRSKFNNCVFKDKTDFSLATFPGSMNFENANFLAYTMFRKTRFSNEESVFFDGDLSNVSFLETDITRTKFGNHVIWNKLNIDKHSLWDKFKNRNKEFKILDERILESGLDSELQLESVMDVYRNLRDNYEYQSRYDMSGEFFVREMELKRKYKTNSTDNQLKTCKRHPLSHSSIILGVYNLMAQYGQSYYRPMYMAIPFLIFSILFFWTGRFSHMEVLTKFGGIELNKAIVRSLSAFFPFYTFDKYQALSDLVLRVVLLPISATFFVALKRKLERQLRH